MVDKPRIYKGRYQEQGYVDKGGFGSVFKAIDLSNPDRPVAIKRVVEEPGNPQSPSKQQIKQEVSLLQKNAPNFYFIPNFFDYWSEETDDHHVHHYIVMEYIEGATLDKLRPLPWTSAEVTGFLQALLGSLQQLHDVGIVHRDIKPLNIKKPEHTYIILDFGISTQHSHTQIYAHSPDFAAPEQIYDRRRADVHVDARTDLYCLAATAFYLLTNTMPTKAELRLARAEFEFPESFLQAPQALQETLLEMLELDMGKRPSSARESLSRLRSRLSQPAQSAAFLAPEAPTTVTTVTEVSVGTTERVGDNAEQPPKSMTSSAIRQEPSRDYVDPGIASGIATPTLAPPQQVFEMATPTLAPPQQVFESVVETHVQGKGRITDIAWSRDGRELAIATALGVYLYDLRDAEKLADAEKLIRDVGSPHVGFALQGQAIGLVTNNSVQFWSRDRQIQMTSPPIPGYRDGAPGTVVFAPDGGMLAVATEHDITLWRVRETQAAQLAVLSENLASPDAGGNGAATVANTNNHIAKLRTALSAGIDLGNVTLSSDGQMLFSTRNDSVILWRPSNAGSPLLRVVHDMPSPVVSIAVAPDGEALAIASDTAFKIWNRYGRQARAAEELPSIACLALDAGGQRLALVVKEAIQIRPISGEESPWTLPGRTTGVFKIVFDPSGQHIAAAARDRVWVWQIENGRKLAEILFSESIERLAFMPDGKMLATAGRSVRLWSVIKGKLSAKPVFERELDHPSAIAFDLKGKLLAAASRDQTIVWPLGSSSGSTRQTSHTIPSGTTQAGGIVFGDNGQQIVNFTGKIVETWKLRSKLRLTHWNVSETYDVTFTPDGQLMAANSDRTISIWRTRDGTPLGDAIKTRAEINSIAFAPDGKTLAVASNRTIQIWSLSKQKWIAEQPARAECLAFAPKGNMLASVNRASIQLWRVEEGRLELLGTTQRHRDTITDVAFGRSEDGWCEFASASHDGTVRLWEYGKRVDQSIDLDSNGERKEPEVSNGEGGPDLSPGPSSPRPLKIFLCYDARNTVRVKKLYEKLDKDGFSPWMAEEDLIGGQYWKNAIEEQVGISDVVIICLSKRFVNNGGFAKEEMDYALEIALRKPKDSIFIIPVKLEECNVPPELENRHYVKYFDKSGYGKLRDALKQRIVNLSNVQDDNSEPINLDNVLGVRPEPINLEDAQANRVDSLPHDVKATHTRLIYLFEILTRTFNGGELKEICFYLAIDYESLAGEGIRDKARELVQYCQRHSIIAKLEQQLRLFRPNVFDRP